MKFLRKLNLRKTCLDRPLSEKKITYIDRNGIEEENFEKRRILHRKGGENLDKLKHLNVRNLL